MIAVPDLHMGKLGNCPGPGELGGGPEKTRCRTRNVTAFVMLQYFRGLWDTWANNGHALGLSRPPNLGAPSPLEKLSCSLGPPWSFGIVPWAIRFQEAPALQASKASGPPMPLGPHASGPLGLWVPRPLGPQASGPPGLMGKYSPCPGPLQAPKFPGPGPSRQVIRPPGPRSLF